jgi:histidinol-phosphate phosphatase family protein
MAKDSGIADGNHRGVGSAAFVAMVLVGGQGTRLREVVADRPKPLAEVDGEPFLLRVLDQLAAAGCTDVVLCAGYRGEAIAAAVGHEHAGMRLWLSVEPTPLGTAGALRHALPLVRAGALLVCNGDSYVDADLAAFVRHARAGGLPTLLATTVDDATRFGRLQVDDHGLLRAFAPTGAPGPGLINAGVYWLPRTLLAQLRPLEAASLERDGLPRWLAEGVAVWVTAAPFLDIGVPADYARAAAFFTSLQQRHRRPRQGLLVVDRDGTLIAEKNYLADPAGVELLPGVIDGLRAFAARGFDLAIVTNQSGLGRGLFDGPTLTAIHDELRRQLAPAGIPLRGIWHCPHTPSDGCRCRKPEPALLEQVLASTGYGTEQCLVVGDKACDIELGARLGMRTALVRTGYGRGTEQDGRCTPDLVVDDLRQLAALEVAK